MPSVNHSRPARRRGRTLARLIVAAAGASALSLSSAGAASAMSPLNDPFYRYAGTTPLADVAPGTILQTRKKKLHAVGINLGLSVVQLAYRTTGMLGQPTVNVTSVILPPFKPKTPRLIAYGSFYDSLNVKDQPSYAIAGGTSLGGSISGIEAALVAPYLLQGYTIVIADTEGQGPDFAAGPEYGMATLDSLRATVASPATGVKTTTKIGMIGYSGGAIATEWAAELGPSYAPDVNKQIVGAAFGGVLVSPAHNLHYIDGSKQWAGVMPMAIIGAARAFQIDLKPYLSTYGLKVYKQLERASIVNAIGVYPGLTWAKMAKPQYGTPEDIPIYVRAVNQLIMGTGGTPTAPLFIGQGAKGEIEGTAGDKPGIGPGDGVMIAGDVRTLARGYCAAGVNVHYEEYAQAAHSGGALKWLPRATTWLAKRFGSGAPIPNCDTIAPGNSLAPIPEVATP